MTVTQDWPTSGTPGRRSIRSHPHRTDTGWSWALCPICNFGIEYHADAEPPSSGYLDDWQNAGGVRE